MTPHSKLKMKKHYENELPMLHVDGAGIEPFMMRGLINNKYFEAAIDSFSSVSMFALDEMKKILNDIQTGEFARNWILENRGGAPRFKAIRRREQNQQIEDRTGVDEIWEKGFVPILQTQQGQREGAQKQEWWYQEEAQTKEQ